MKTFAFSLIAALLLLFSAAAHSQFEPIPSDHKRNSLDGLKQHLYVQTSLLPDEWALRAILAVMGDPNPPEDIREFNVELIQQRMGMSQGEARRFLQYLINVNRKYEKDLYRLQVRMACSPDHPRKSGDEIYKLFEMMYAGKKALLSQYLAIMASDLTKDQYNRFDNWLDDKKLEVTHFTTHHKKAFEAAGTNPDLHLNAICDRLMMAVPHMN